MKPIGRERFGQLTYTSFDDGSGSGGGWQVKETAGGLDSAEREALTARVTTRFDLLPGLDRYPTPDAIMHRQRRLVYARVDAGAAYWHTAEAGTDGSGRPGNVFAHVVLDRSIATPEPVFRPIEMWWSPSWLVPYGAEATRTALLPTGQWPVAGGVVTRESVVGFLSDASVYRLGVLQVLLDAVAGTLDGGLPVVFAVADTELAPFWIGAVSYFMSAGTSRSFTWSTHDRAAAVEDNVRRNIHLTIVPATEREALGDAHGILLLSEDDDLTLGLLDGEGHTTGSGACVQVTPWSLLAQAVLIDEDTAVSALAAQDDVAQEAGDVGLAAMWPLAMAVSEMPEMGDVAREASRVVVENRPKSLDHESRLALVSDRIDNEHAPVALSEARAAVDRACSRGRDVSSALSHYVLLALNDPHASLVEEPVRAAFTRPMASAFSSFVLDALGRLATENARDDAASIGRAVRTLAIANLLLSTETDTAVDFDLVEELSRAVENVGQVLTTSETSAEVMATVGALHERTLRLVVRPVLATLPPMQVAPFGQRYTSQLLGWLYPRVPTLPHLQQISAGSIAADAEVDVALYAERAYGYLVTGWGNVESRRAMLQYADLAIWGLLVEMREKPGSVDRRSEVRRLAELGTLSAADLRALFETFDMSVPVGLAYRSVVQEMSTPVLVWVLNRVSVFSMASDVPDPTDTATAAWASLRLLPEWHSSDPAVVREFLDRHLDTVLDDFAMRRASRPPIAFTEDVVGRLSVMVEIAEARGRDVSALSPSDRAVLASWIDEHPDVLRLLIACGVIDVDTLVGRVFADFVDSAGRSHASTDDRAEAFIRDLVRRGVYNGPDDTEALRDAMWPAVRKTRAAHAERLLGTYREFAAEWFRKMEIVTDRTDVPSVRGGEVVT